MPLAASGGGSSDPCGQLREPGRYFIAERGYSAENNYGDRGHQETVFDGILGPFVTGKFVDVLKHLRGKQSVWNPEPSCQYESSAISTGASANWRKLAPNARPTGRLRTIHAQPIPTAATTRSCTIPPALSTVQALRVAANTRFGNQLFSSVR
jgi:hypothetical protein